VTRRTPSWAVPAVLLLVVAVWGAAFSGIKVLLRDLSPGGLTSARLAVAALSFTLFLPLAPKRQTRWQRRDLPRLVVAGLFASVGYHYTLNWGEQFVSAGLASLLVATMPVMVAVGGAVVLRERLGPLRAAGAGVAFAGVTVLVLSSGSEVQARSTAGVMVTLLAPACWAAYTILAKPLTETYDGVRINLIGAWVGALAVVPLGLGELGALARLDAAGWFWLVYLGAISQAASYVAYAWALRRWTASRVASVVFLVPVSSLLTAWVLLGEVPHVLAIAGGALVIAGVWLVQRNRRPRRLPPTPVNESEALRIMTFNIRFGNAADLGNRWERRRDIALDVVRDAAPDVLGLQECLDFQLADLRAGLPHMDVVEGARYARLSMNAILYDARRLRVDGSGSFWLSENPDVDGPKAWDAFTTRNCSWALLTDTRKGRRFVVLNTHLDHRGETARLRSAELVAARAAAFGAPVVVMGDLNEDEGSEPLGVLHRAGLRDTFRVVRAEDPDACTFHGFTGQTSGRKLDFVLCGDAWEVRDAGIVRTSRNGRYPSDHYPVIAEVRLQ
jgi:drug/metabolite transporter (DMT)-like permease/endonuclease/exonuclease/phosphatase family metal-dependent hydrolase